MPAVKIYSVLYVACCRVWTILVSCSVHIYERSLDNAANITRFNNAVNTLHMTDVKEALH